MGLGKATLGAAACAIVAGGGALVAQTVAASGSVPSSSAATVRADVGQLVVLGFQGTSAPGWLRRLLSRGDAAGVILFGSNVRSRGQLRGLTGSLQRAARGGAIVSVDQEGGTVRRVRWLGPPAQPLQRSPRRTRASARAAARGLRAAGVNLDLAPVADVAVGRSAMRSRAFPGGPAAVAALTAAAVRGFSAGGVGSTAKHFPGFGRARANTDDHAVTIGASRRGLERDLRPFRAAIRADVPAVMVSHGLYPAYDRRRIASQSPAVLRLLRERLGFDGAVVTDSMDAAAVLARSSVETAAVRAVAAGADLLLVGGPGTYKRVHRRLVATARRSPRFRARVGAAAQRVRDLKRRLGLHL
jgi:beta-N-acetylhexosaminidase